MMTSVVLSCSTLILRANSWLEENPGYNVVACQTVTWMGRRFKDIYADSCAAERSMHAAKSTKFLIWTQVSRCILHAAKSTNFLI